MLCDRLAALVASYADLPAHDGLWQAADTIKDDLLARLAIAPLVLETRGLDVTPAMIDKLTAYRVRVCSYLQPEMSGLLLRYPCIYHRNWV